MTKADWQRQRRAEFKREFGYSMTAHYRAGMMREDVLARDGFKCVRCGMTDEQHRQMWAIPITIDHKDRNRKNNSLSNLQTLCLVCHGAKDLLPRLRVSKLLPFRDQVIAWRVAGISCNAIAQRVGVGCRVVTKWVRQWRKDDPLCQKQ